MRCVFFSVLQSTLATQNHQSTFTVKNVQIAVCFHHDLSSPLVSVMAFTCAHPNQHRFRALLNLQSVEALYGLFVLIMGLCLSNRHMPPLKPTTSAAGYPSHSAERSRAVSIRLGERACTFCDVCREENISAAASVVFAVANPHSAAL